MMNRRAISIVILAGLIFLHTGCRKKAYIATPDNKNTPAVSLIMTDLDSAYALGEGIELRMRLIVDSPKPVEIMFPSSCPAEFVVFREGEPIWNSLEGMACLQVINRVTFDPSDTTEYSTLWNCTTNSWKGVTLGRYSVQGILLSTPPLKTEVQTFHLVD
ncbi:MAG TPA: hypothetical protein ENN75_01585 [candidate division Zixibacteria bacterium]|nr:hypothetical protein [candidate division Zixibacteria bacterium]